MTLAEILMIRPRRSRAAAAEESLMAARMGIRLQLLDSSRQ